MTHQTTSPRSFSLLTGIFAIGIGAFGAAGCASEVDDGSTEPSADGTDNVYSEDNLISEGQLFGRDLAPKEIALTFDDGPGPRTAELSKYLKEQNIPATFFINGKNVPGRQNVLTQIISDGHIVANHTQNHVQLTKLSSANAVNEIVRTDEFIVQSGQAGPWLLRPPFGAWSGSIARAANQTAMSKYVGSVFWDIGGDINANAAADWACWSAKYKYSVKQCGDLYLKETRSRGRGIVLMHDIHSPTVDMVKQLVPVLKAEGFKFVKVSDVPSIKSKIDAGQPAPETCFSSTLRKNVAAGSCVQSARDSKWYVCEEEAWSAVPSSTAPACKSLPR
jgi:peptidoglycan/xylan/chitin deacetylase (PgdA/CDA1 family)